MLKGEARVDGAMRGLRGPRAVVLLAILLLAGGLAEPAAAASEPAESPWGGFLRYRDRLHGAHLSVNLVEGNLTPLLAGRDGGALLSSVAGGNLTALEVFPNGTALATGDTLRVTLHDTPLRTLTARANGTATLELRPPPGGTVEPLDGGARITAGTRVGLLHPDANATVTVWNGTIHAALGEGGGLVLAWYEADDPLLDLALRGLHTTDARATSQTAAAWSRNGPPLPDPTYDGVRWTVPLPPASETRLLTVSVDGLVQGHPRVLLEARDLARVNATNLTPEASGTFATLNTEPATLGVLLPASETAANLTLLLDGEAPRVLEANLVDLGLHQATFKVRVHEAANITLLARADEHEATARPEAPVRAARLVLSELHPDTLYETVLHVADAHGNAHVLPGPTFRTSRPSTPEDPVILRLHPARGATVLPDAELGADYRDPTATLDPATHVRLRLDGVDVTGDATINATAIRYAPPEGLSPGEHRLHLTLLNEDGGTARALWTFQVDAPPSPPPVRGAPAFALPAALAVLAAAVVLARGPFRR